MSSGYEVVDEVRFGDQEGFPSEWKTIRAVFPNFAELPSKRDDHTDSPVLKCHGMEWDIWLCPGGDSTSSNEEVFISIYLYNKSCSKTNRVKAKYRIRVPSAGRGWRGKGFRVFSHKPGIEGDGWGHRNCAKREDVLDASKNYLVDGSLTVEVDIQVMLDETSIWTPTNTLSPDMLAYLDTADADNTDVAFEVASEDGKECLYAHGQILAARCPTLASLVEGCDPDTPIPIEDVQADVFRMLLRFIYGGEVPRKDVLKEEARGIIRAADRFGCTGLKLTAEAELASAAITTENAAELILFADSHTCAMLKEMAMEFFVKNAQAVMASEGFVQVKESPAVMAELMDVGFGGSKKRPASSDAVNGRDYKQMCVAILWQKLDDKGLDLGGSREMLVARLEEAEALAQAEADAESDEDGDDVIEIE